MHGEAPTSSPLPVTLLPSTSPFLVRSFIGVGAAAFPFPFTCSPPHPKSSACSGRLVGRSLACCKASQGTSPRFYLPKRPPSLLFLLFPFFHPSFAFLAATVANITTTSTSFIVHAPNLSSNSSCISHPSLPDRGCPLLTASKTFSTSSSSVWRPFHPRSSSSSTLSQI